MPLQDDYEVRLSSFQGPLDLLLYLVRRAEVDISDIPIAMITEQYFGFLKHINHVDVDLAGEFLVMAATLVEIKSRTLAPRPAQDDADTAGIARESADPRLELVQQLLAYQQFRTAAGALDRLRALSAKRYGAGAHGGSTSGEQADQEFSVEIEDAHVLDLVESFERIMQSVDVARLGDHRIEFDDTPISLHQADLVDRLARSSRKRLTLAQIFDGRTRSEMIGLFLALLELARQQQVAVKQDDADAPLEIELLQLSPDPSLASGSPASDAVVEIDAVPQDD